MTSIYFVEVTDTFGGEANYCWARRYRVNAASQRGAISKISRHEGLHFRNTGNRYDASNACVCAFIDDWDDNNHSDYTCVKTI